MNYLPIILITAFLLLNDKSGKDLLSGIDLEGLSPILNLLGVDENLVKTFLDGELLSALKSGGDIKTLLPTLIKTVSSITANPSFSAPPNTVEETLTPIEEFAGNEVLATLGNYFSH